jgi:hypothetical protein
MEMLDFCCFDYLTSAFFLLLFSSPANSTVPAVYFFLSVFLLDPSACSADLISSRHVLFRLVFSPISFYFFDLGSWILETISGVVFVFLLDMIFLIF